MKWPWQKVKESPEALNQRREMAVVERRLDMVEKKGRVVEKKVDVIAEQLAVIRRNDSNGDDS